MNIGREGSEQLQSPSAGCGRTRPNLAVSSCARCRLCLSDADPSVYTQRHSVLRNGSFRFSASQMCVVHPWPGCVPESSAMKDLRTGPPAANFTHPRPVVKHGVQGSFILAHDLFVLAKEFLTRLAKARSSGIFAMLPGGGIVEQAAQIDVVSYSQDRIHRSCLFNVQSLSNSCTYGRQLQSFTVDLPSYSELPHPRPLRRLLP